MVPERVLDGWDNIGQARQVENPVRAVNQWLNFRIVRHVNLAHLEAGVVHNPRQILLPPAGEVV